jgi:hypothetical protein
MSERPVSKLKVRAAGYIQHLLTAEDILVAFPRAPDPPFQVGVDRIDVVEDLEWRAPPHRGQKARGKPQTVNHSYLAL